MLEKIKDLFKKAPKGFVALPIALAVVILATVIAIPFLGSDSGNGGKEDNVISFHDKEDSDEDEDLEQDASADKNENNSDDSKDDSDDKNEDSSKDEGDTESGDDSQSGNNGSTDDTNNSGSTGSNNGGTSSGTSSNSGSSNTGNTGNSGNSGNGSTGSTGSADLNVPGISLSQIPAFSGSYAITLNNGNPYFSTTNLSTNAYEYYSELDSFGRCGVAYACLGKELMPTEERGDISSIKPSGWVQKQYDCVPGNALWNRSHLIAFSLSGENANAKNLITGTQHMNQIEMQVYETQVLNYIKETGNHVLYRVTPMFEGNNLVATGVQMEAWSIEDNGETICFNVFIYNVQDGIIINYATGDSEMTEEAKTETENEIPEWALYVVHKTKGTIHSVDCSSLPATKNREYFATYEEALARSREIDPDKDDSKRAHSNCVKNE